ncbi:MAG TPA: EFR1 family ferrodoxin [Spirochaetota bacterium]|nr:EFR1 family ferrodoxin [Spirochaetota bacterium]
MPEIKEVITAYFSGTGGTRMVTDRISEVFAQKHVSNERIHIKHDTPSMLPPHDFLIIAYPVYAMNAPEIVYRWADSLPDVKGIEAAVISVSGGGEVFPNRACRSRLIRKLTRKGYSVRYENMIVMPANYIKGVDIHVAAKLLEVLPIKTLGIVEAILGGTVRRDKPPLAELILSRIALAEQFGAHRFGKGIRVDNRCTGCSACISNCPAGNITLADSRPVFSGKCQLCMNCIYGCPVHALTPGRMKSLVLKEGYSIKKAAELLPLSDDIDISDRIKGLAWVGVRKYLNEDN